VTEPVVLFDGVCNLCNASVQFMIDRDPKSELKFAAIQSEKGGELLTKTVGEAQAKELAAGTTGDGDPDSIVLVENGQIYMRSTAALRIARHLSWPWRFLFAFLIVPRPLRDVFYKLIARNRYRWFGKSDTCRIPTPELRARFLA
jgi:predicted DCC family thiol-disulfide oxidoreductase YuxK